MNLQNNMKKTAIFIISLICYWGVEVKAATQPTDCIDLSGLWRFQLDPMNFGKTPGSELYKKKLTETIVLPGSTDESGKGIKNTFSHVDRLSRKYEYEGQAWYQREIMIPEAWKDKEIILLLERCHWETTVYVNGMYVAADERLSTPNRFVLTQQIEPGVHTLTLCVDNRIKYPMDSWNHGTTEYTQTNWNGVVGKIELLARNKTYIRQMDVYPNAEKNSASVKLKLIHKGDEHSGELQLTVREKDGKTIATSTTQIHLSDSFPEINREISLGKDLKLWDEFTPHLYEIDALLTINKKEDTQTVVFGVRDVKQGVHHIRLNGNNIHLRGVLDCAVFPLTGYPSVCTEDWKRIFTTVKSYGMNHVRFHSWCPPKAAFEAADEIGIYVQAELPMWIKDVGQYPSRRDFFEKEMYALLNEYGNHPSFILMCNGNENEGDFNVLEDLVRKAQVYDDRRLYSASTARTHVKADQYYVSHVTHKGGITVYEGRPATNWDKSKESDIDVPVIAHESGQRCMYPNFEEIKKYTGVLEARNFNVFQERLAANGMLHQADDFFKATGAHTVLQYKEVNEALLRTANSGGFQLLGLADFPGQGSAFIGVLDAFWECKGLVTPEKFRESCGPIVILARFPKRIYLNHEQFSTRLDVYNYNATPVKNKKLNWQLTTESDEVIQKGTLSISVINCATVDSVAQLTLDLSKVDKAGKLTLQVSLNNVTRNEWDIWVYPSQSQVASDENFIYADKWDEKTKEHLKNGKNVLLVPTNPIGRKTKFAGHFWNPIMFNWKPLIVGTLIADKHPAFEDFPTAYYADWQWWDILNYGTALEMSEINNITPLIQCIDSYETNKKLGIAFESQVDNGNLFVLSIDAEKDIEQRTATRQLLFSVRKYMSSNQFKPSERLHTYELDALFYQVDDKKDLNNSAVKQLLNK